MHAARHATRQVWDARPLVIYRVGDHSGLMAFGWRTVLRAGDENVRLIDIARDVVVYLQQLCLEEQPGRIQPVRGLRSTVDRLSAWAGLS